MFPLHTRFPSIAARTLNQHPSLDPHAKLLTFVKHFFTFMFKLIFSYDLERANPFLSEECGATYNNRSSISHPYSGLA